MTAVALGRHERADRRLDHEVARPRERQCHMDAVLTAREPPQPHQKRADLGANIMIPWCDVPVGGGTHIGMGHHGTRYQ